MAEHAEYEGDDSFSKAGKVKLLQKFLGHANCPFECLVVEADGIVQGYTTFLPQFDTWLCADFMLLDALFLQPSLRGLGAGTKLMAKIRKRAKQLNCSSVRWQTPANNKIGIRFYTKLKAHATKTVFFHLETK